MPNWLPLGFERGSSARAMRRKVRAALRRHPVKYEGKRMQLGRCLAEDPCHSGLCPSCLRGLRRGLLRFLSHQRLHRREWYLVTIRVAGWTKAVGDYTPFGPLREHPAIKAYLGRLRRQGHADLVLFGSIETVFKTVANKAVGKPFHLHFMISGASKADINEAVRSTFKLDRSTRRALDVERVDPGRVNFVRAASYVFKQPYWKKSHRTFKSRDGWRQFPKPNELAELISNLGAHPWNGRLIMVGMRFDQGVFRMT